MANYRITGPDGHVYKVTAPDDATQEQVYSMVAGQAKAPAPEPAAPAGPEKSKFESFKEGFGDSTIKAALGIKQVFGGLSDDQKAVLREIEKAEEADPNKLTRTAGGAGSSILQAALPGKIGLKGVQALTKTLGFMGKAAPIATSALVSGTGEALTTPSLGETTEEVATDKAKAGGVAAALGGTISTLAKGAGKVATGLFTPTQEAKDLIAQGVTPTLQQGAESWIGKKVGGLTSGVADIEKRQSKEIVDAIGKRLAPGEEVEKYTKAELVAASKNSIDADYDQLLKGTKFSLLKTHKATLDNVISTAKGARDDAKDLARKQLDGVFPDRSITNMGPSKLNEYREVLQNRIDELAKDDSVVGRQARDILTDVKNKFDITVRDVRLGADDVAKVADIDSRAYDFARLRNAADNTTGELTSKDVARAYQRMAPTGQTALGGKSAVEQEILGPSSRVLGDMNQEESRAALQALRRVAKLGGGAVANLFAPQVAAPLYGISALGQSAAGAKALFGETAAQKKLAELLRKTQGAGAGAGSILYNPTGEQ